MPQTVKDMQVKIIRSESTQIVQLAYRTGPFFESASIDQTGKEWLRHFAWCFELDWQSALDHSPWCCCIHCKTLRETPGLIPSRWNDHPLADVTGTKLNAKPVCANFLCRGNWFHAIAGWADFLCRLPVSVSNESIYLGTDARLVLQYLHVSLSDRFVVLEKQWQNRKSWVQDNILIKEQSTHHTVIPIKLNPHG